MTEIFLSQRYTTYFWHHSYVTDYFSTITLMNLGHACLFNKGFYTVYFGEIEKMRLHYHKVHKGNTHFLGEIKEMSKNKKLPSKKKISLSLLQQRLGHRSTRYLLAGDTANIWEYIELTIYPDPFFHIM